MSLIQVVWQLMFWDIAKQGAWRTIHHRQASCVSDASRYSTLAPAHWTCMALENARKEEGGPAQLVGLAGSYGVVCGGTGTNKNPIH